jgi:hypothetical protein
LNSIGYIWRAYVPLSFQGVWNSNLLDHWPWLQVALALILFIAVILLLLRRPTALLFFVLGTLMSVFLFCCLQTANYSYAVRYQGIYFIVLIISLWLAQTTREARWQFLDCGPLVTWGNQLSSLLVSILGVHVVAASMAVAHEQVIPFSGSREAVEIIRQKAPPDVPVISDTDYAVTAIAGYLDRPVFEVSLGEYTVNKTNVKGWRVAPLSADELGKAVNDFLAREKRDVVLVINYFAHHTGDDSVQQLGVVTNSMQTDEQFCIFLIKYRGP